MQPVLAIANRAEIAVRIARTARRLGWQPVVLLGDPDLGSYAAREISLVEPLGPAGRELDVEQVVAAAQRAGATALHPGYGFLSERPELSRRCAEVGISFVGPSPETLEMAGDKLATRAAAVRAGAPILPASAALTIDDRHVWADAAAEIGYPVIAKVVNAGGGRGLRVVREPGELPRAINSALNEAGGSGSEARLYLERYVEGARHVEVQVVGDGVDAVALGDRDCSLQRRHQKVIEEAPAPGLSDAERAELWAHAVLLAREIGLRSLATVEFLHAADGAFYFLEINPRLQVEHTVTEQVTGLDLVAIQLTLITGGSLPEPVTSHGHAIQARLYAEDPFQNFLPSPGRFTTLHYPRLPELRIDYGYETGDEFPSHYDPLIAKLISHGVDRTTAIADLHAGLSELAATGVATNRPWLLALIDDPAFRENRHSLLTAEVVKVEPRPPSAAEVRAVVAQLERPSAGGNAWDALGPFRIVQPATIALHGQEFGGWQLTVALDAAAEADPFTLAVPAQASWELVSPGGRWLVETGPLPQRDDAQRRLDGVLRAPMPGKVLSVNAQAGQLVAEGDVVAVLEAMKIEITLAAPFAGQVSEVHVAAGALVGSRQPVVTILPEAAEFNS